MKQQIKVGDVVCLKESPQQDELSAGSIVHLNSGSPDLEVIGISDEGVSVEWKNESGETQTATFPRACLTLQAVPAMTTHGL